MPLMKAKKAVAALHESVTLSHEDLRDRLRTALEKRFAVDPSTMEGIWIKNTYSVPSEVVYEYAGRLWRIGYTLDERGDVVLAASEEEVLANYDPVEQHTGMHTIAELARPLTILESTADDPALRYEGCVLVDEVLSQGGKGRYYSREFNDRCMEATNLYLAAGGVITVYSRHGRAAGETGRAPYPTGLPVGRVSKPLWRKGAEVLYEAVISPTTEGQDVMVLIRDEVLRATSLRASGYSSRMRKLADTDRLVEEMVSAVIVGIDLCDRAGIEGAGIRRILEEAPQWRTETVEEEDDPMDFAELTLESLVEHRQDLLDAHTTPLLEARDAQIATLADANTALKEQLTAASAPAPDADRLAILEASSCGLSKIMAEKLTAKGVKTPAEIQLILEAVRAESLQELVADAPPTVVESAVGVTNLPDTTPGGLEPLLEPGSPEADPVKQRIVALSSGRGRRRSRG